MKRESWDALAWLALVAAWISVGVADVWNQPPPPAPMVFHRPAEVAPDAPHLRALARLAGVDPRVVVQVALHESQQDLRPRLRGKAGEWGRFQILPRTARRRCHGLDTRTYHGNVSCFFQMFGADNARHGIVFALHQQNHSTAYAERVLADALGDQ